jgi:hypothetical protein
MMLLVVKLIPVWIQYVAIIPITPVINGKLILVLNPGTSSQVYGFF